MLSVYGMKEKKKKRKDDFYDDGRSFANMNIEGMRDYCPMPEHSDGERGESGEKFSRVVLDRRERRAVYFGIMKATLLVLAVFIAAYTLFFLFCDFIWLS